MYPVKRHTHIKDKKTEHPMEKYLCNIKYLYHLVFIFLKIYNGNILLYIHDDVDYI